MNPMDCIVYNLMPKGHGQPVRSVSESFGNIVLGSEEHLVRMPTELFYCLEEAAQKMGLIQVQELLALLADKDVVSVKLELTLKAKSVTFTLDGPVEGDSHE